MAAGEALRKVAWLDVDAALTRRSMPIASDSTRPKSNAVASSTA